MELFPEIKHKMINFCHHNLINISIERVHEELVKKIVPSQIAHEGIITDEETTEIRERNENSDEAAVTSDDDDVIGAIIEDQATINSKVDQSHKPFPRKYNRSNGYEALKSYYLKQPSLESVRRWVKATGFMYVCEKKIVLCRRA